MKKQPKKKPRARKGKFIPTFYPKPPKEGWHEDMTLVIKVKD